MVWPEVAEAVTEQEQAPVQELFAVAGSGDAFLQHLNVSFVERTVSRLIEMQTHDYLALAHEG